MHVTETINLQERAASLYFRRIMDLVESLLDFELGEPKKNQDGPFSALSAHPLRSCLEDGLSDPPCTIHKCTAEFGSLTCASRQSLGRLPFSHKTASMARCEEENTTTRVIFNLHLQPTNSCPYQPIQNACICPYYLGACDFCSCDVSPVACKSSGYYTVQSPKYCCPHLCTLFLTSKTPSLTFH